jgi:hypothetical protein
MNFFKKSDWVELNAKDFGKFIAKLPEYRSLVSTIGVPHAQGTTLALWNKFGGFSESVSKLMQCVRGGG